MSELVVVKVGGSLFDWTSLRLTLPAFLNSLPSRDVLLIAGGGASADVVRAWHRCHRLDDETAHWLAIRSMSFNSHLLSVLLEGAPIVAELHEFAGQCRLLDVFAFCQGDDALAHDWSVTSDAIAARVAVRAAARELIFLKSASKPMDMTWEVAAVSGIVDVHVPGILAAAPRLKARIVNLRATVS